MKYTFFFYTNFKEGGAKKYTQIPGRSVKEYPYIEGLSYANIDDIYIEDKDKTFFDEKTFTLKAAMLVTDKNDYVQSYALTIKNVKLIADNVSTKSYENGAWELGLYSLELPWQTDIDIVEITD